MGSAHAVTLFNDRVKAATIIDIILTQEQQTQVSDRCPNVNLFFRGTQTSGGMHPAIAALRMVARQAHAESVGVTAGGYKEGKMRGNDMLRICCMGATAREAQLYAKNPNVKFYVHGGEAKDLARTQVSMLGSIYAKRKRPQTSRGTAFFEDRNALHAAYSADVLESPTNRFVVGGEMPKCVIMLYEDCGYNITGQQYLEDFAKSGAMVAYGLGVYPDEILTAFRNAPEDPLYRMRFLPSLVPGEERAQLTFMGCNGNGYSHKLSTWGLPLHTPVIRDARYPFVLVFEIRSSFGPMRTWSLTRVNVADTIVREIWLPEYRRYMRILDIPRSFVRGTAKLRPEGAQYVSVAIRDWDRMINYAHSLDPKALTYNSLYSFWGRTQGGLAIASVTVRKSELDRQLYTAVLTAVIVVTRMAVNDVETNTRVMADVRGQNLLGAVKQLGCLLGGLMMAPVRHVVEFFTEHGVLETLAVEGADSVTQAQRICCPSEELAASQRRLRGDGPAYSKYLRDVAAEFVDAAVVAGEMLSWSKAPVEGAGYHVCGDDELGEDEYVFDTTEAEAPGAEVGFSGPKAEGCASRGPLTPAATSEPTCKPSCDGCWFCSEIKPTLGAQVVGCRYREESDHAFALDEKQVLDYLNDLHTQAEVAPAGLKEVLSLAYLKCKKLGSTWRHKCRVSVISAPPGTGKSYAIRKALTGHDGVLCPFKELRKDYTDLKDEDGAPLRIAVCTPHRAITDFGVIDVLYVDEAFCMCYGTLCAVIVACQPREVYLVGDPLQTQLQLHEGLPMLAHIDIETLSTHTLAIDFRNPPSAVAVLNVIGYPDLRSNKPRLEAWEPGYGLDFITADSYLPDAYPEHHKLMFSHKTADMLSPQESGDDKRCTLIRGYQGRTLPKVILFLDGRVSDRMLMQMLPMLRVAVSRHTEHMVIVFGNNNESMRCAMLLGLGTPFHALFGELGLGYGYMGGQQDAPSSYVEPDVPLPIYRATCDAYQHTPFMVPPEAVTPLTTSHNLESSAHIHGGQQTMIINPGVMLGQLAKGGVPAKSGTEYYSQGPGIGNHYGNNIGQVINVATVRHDQAVPNSRLNLQAPSLCRDMFENYLTLATVKAGDWRPLPDHAMETIIQQAYADCVRKGYHKKVASQDILTPGELRKIMFTLKPVFKVGVGKPIEALKLCKVGQGISAWTPSANSMFTSIVRILVATFRWNERHDDQFDIVTDDKMAEEDFLEMTTRLLKGMPMGSVNAVQDGEMFDAQQNEATQLLERLMWEKVVHPDIIELYYSYRKHYELKVPFLTVTAGCQKTSGEVFTLEGNGLISRMLALYIMRWEGPVVVIFKGDDLALRALNVRVDPIRQAAVESIMPLRLKISIGAGADFCGYAVIGGAVVPSIMRRFEKLTGHRVADYASFALLATALRDFTGMVQRLQTKAQSQYIIAGNAQLYGLSVEQVNGAYDSIVSMGHIDEAQFKQTWKKRVEYPVLLSAELGNGSHDLVELRGAGPVKKSQTFSRAAVPLGASMKSLVAPPSLFYKGYAVVEAERNLALAATAMRLMHVDATMCGAPGGATGIIAGKIVHAWQPEPGDTIGVFDAGTSN